MAWLGLICVLLAASAIAAGCGAESGEPPARTSTATPAPTTTPAEREIAWDDAIELIMDCQVTTGGQAHSRQVWLTLRDGSEVTTVEPVLDDLFTVVRDATAGGCEQVSLWTE